MPLPNPRVFTAFLNGYVKVRQTKWNSTVGYLQSWYKDTASEKLGDAVAMNRNFYDGKLYEPIEVARGEGEEQIVELSYQTMLDEWIKLLSELGKAGREQTLLGATFHAIRTYAVAMLNQSDMGDLFRAHISELQQKTRALDESITQAILKKAKREDVEKFEAQYKSNLMLLCDLGDEASIIKAHRTNLFGKLNYPNRHDVSTPFLSTLNENIPFYYHENYYKIHFETFYRKQLSMTFEDFEQRSAIETAPTEVMLPNEGEALKATATITSMFGNVGSMFTSYMPGARKPASPEAVVDPAAADQSLRNSSH